MKYTQQILLSILSLFIFSCDKQQKPQDTWFVGKIDNPRKDYIIIKQNRFILDTAKLDENNYFYYKFPEDVKEGIYSFVHDETYSFYITAGDSLLMLANTLDFENSIYYTNSHAKENNFFKEINKTIYANKFNWTELCDSSYEDFSSRLESNQKELMQRLDSFLSKNDKTSDKFKHIIKSAINANELYNKESYLYAQQSILEHDEFIPQKYYEHREQIPLAVDTFEVYFPYYRLLHTYFDNMALDSLNRTTAYSKSDAELKEYKLNLIDQLIEQEGVRNNMFYTTVRRYLLHATDSTEEKKILNLHHQLSTCSISKEKLDDLSFYTIALKPGKTIPNLRILTHDNSDTYLRDVIKRPSLLYFWSDKDLQHHKEIHRRVRDLAIKFPEFDYIGINLDDHFKNWRKTINRLAYNGDFEYQLYHPKEGAKELVVSFKNKAIILDAEARIIQNHTHIFQADIENELLESLNM